MYITSTQYSTYLDSYEKQGHLIQGNPLGRLFCSDFNISDPDLFRENDNKVAAALIRKRYVA